jgi:signal transduction histidine kinase
MRPNDPRPPSRSSNQHGSGAAGVGESDARRDALLSAICHDLRAPLAAVMMGANFVLQTTPEDAAGGRSKRVLKAMVRSCRQMERLVRSFGEISEIESGRVLLRPGLHDAAQIADLVLEAARESAEARSITLEGLRPAAAVHVRCDRDRMLGALGHLVDNAIRFAPDGSTVTLRLEDDADAVRFAVIDHGPGIPEETLPHLYDRSWHAAQSNRSGAGLGLAIAHGVVVAHGGSIDVALTPEPTTTFTVRLPKSLH